MVATVCRDDDDSFISSLNPSSGVHVMEAIVTSAFSSVARAKVGNNSSTDIAVLIMLGILQINPRTVGHFVVAPVVC